MPEVPPITEAEWIVLDGLWSDGPKTAQALHGSLPHGTDWTLGTVKTLLSRLVRKGAVTHEAEGKRYVYRAAVTQNACVKRMGKQLLRRARGTAKSPLLAFFLRESRLDSDEIDRLRALLDELEGKAR